MRECLNPRVSRFLIAFAALLAASAYFGGVGGAQGPAAPESPASSPSAAPAASAVPLVQVRRVSYSRGPRYARIVIETERETAFRVEELAADPAAELPPRIFVDLSSSVRAAGLPEEVSGEDSLVRRLRVGQFDARTVRVVIDLKAECDNQTITLYDPFRIVIDVYQKASGSPGGAAALEAGAASPDDDGIARILSGQSPAGEGAGEAAGETGPAASSLPAPGISPAPAPIRKTSRRAQIIVDPGHGGKDPGAVGRTGTKEKDVVLAISRRLAARLREAGYRVLLTRDDDRYLTLSERTAFANERAEPGDLFVSVHANSSPSRKASGVETYYWNVAVDRSGASTVARENFTNLEAVFRHENSDLQAILSDLQYKEKERASASLAGFLQAGIMSRVLRLYRDTEDIGVRHGPLYVLALTNVPAVLVETGFVSHRAEEKRLKRKDYQDALAQGIVRGIQRYLKEDARMEAR